MEVFLVAAKVVPQTDGGGVQPDPPVNAGSDIPPGPAPAATTALVTCFTAIANSTGLAGAVCILVFLGLFFQRCTGLVFHFLACFQYASLLLGGLLGACFFTFLSSGVALSSPSSPLGGLFLHLPLLPVVFWESKAVFGSLAAG
jgi:hypothetical protein